MQGGQHVELQHGGRPPLHTSNQQLVMAAFSRGSGQRWPPACWRHGLAAPGACSSQTESAEFERVARAWQQKCNRAGGPATSSCPFRPPAAHAARPALLLRSPPFSVSFSFSRLKMATAIKPAQKPGVEEAEAAPIHRIRITLTSKNVKNLEKGEWSG